MWIHFRFNIRSERIVISFFFLFSYFITGQAYQQYRNETDQTKSNVVINNKSNDNVSILELKFCYKTPIIESRFYQILEKIKTKRIFNFELNLIYFFK